MFTKLNTGKQCLIGVGTFAAVILGTPFFLVGGVITGTAAFRWMVNDNAKGESSLPSRCSRAFKGVFVREKVEKKEKEDKKEAPLTQTEQAIKSTAPISPNFTSEKTIEEQQAAHESTKIFLIKELNHIETEINFISHKKTERAPLSTEIKIDKTALKASVFSFEETKGVKEDIIEAGKRSDNALAPINTATPVILIGGASQFNNGENRTNATTEPGRELFEYNIEIPKSPTEPLRDPTQEAIKTTKPISLNFTSDKTIEEQRKAHDKAIDFLKEIMQRIGGEVYFTHPGKKAPPLTEVRVGQQGSLNENIFKFQYTQGVEHDVKRAGQRLEEKVVIFVGAGQANGVETKDNTKTPSPGGAVELYQKDKCTQGANLQLSFQDEQTELIACAANRGLNALCYVLDDTTRAEVVNGYFSPTEQHVKEVITQLRKDGEWIQYPCIGGIPKEGQKMVYEMLVFAPVFGVYLTDNSPREKQDQDEVEFLCAFYSYLAQFKQAIDLAIKKGLPVELNTTIAGGNAFGNEASNIAKGFYQAAKEYETAFEINKVKVILQVFKHGNEPDRFAEDLAINYLGLKELKVQRL